MDLLGHLDDGARHLGRALDAALELKDPPLSPRERAEAKSLDRVDAVWAKLRRGEDRYDKDAFSPKRNGVDPSWDPATVAGEGWVNEEGEKMNSHYAIVQKFEEMKLPTMKSMGKLSDASAEELEKTNFMAWAADNVKRRMGSPKAGIGPEATVKESKGDASKWKEAKCPSTGRSYWFNEETQESVWEDPTQDWEPSALPRTNLVDEEQSAVAGGLSRDFGRWSKHARAEYEQRMERAQRHHFEVMARKAEEEEKRQRARYEVRLNLWPATRLMRALCCCGPRPPPIFNAFSLLLVLDFCFLFRHLLLLLFFVLPFLREWKIGSPQSRRDQTPSSVGDCLYFFRWDR
jgi:hypothetical protein